ncbi:hypothetical protein [Paenibacillus daejeonensis]|uniref:hypothetical protein n=1 Tax=Paenibacillus daejeonensis TaxID=135193 RepID=UPI000381A56D|nr:hypothetical protein [Paenibacillus daejeonensis]
MIKYGADRVTELKFAAFYPKLERRDDQWVDIVLSFDLQAESDERPADLIDLTALIICTHGGQVAQIIPQDEGCDCEYQFTTEEKAQIAAFIEEQDMQSRIHQVAG